MKNIADEVPEGHVVTARGEWFDGEGSIFLVWGILNPDGPTLYCLGQKRVDGRWRTFFRWFHMFDGLTTYLSDTADSITYQDVYNDAENIHRHLVREGEPGLFHVIPSFLIANGDDKTLIQIAQRLLCNGTAAQEDWGRHIAYVRQFGTDLMGRLVAEIREFYDAHMAEATAEGQGPSGFLRYIEFQYGHRPGFKNAEIPKSIPSAMTPALLDEWLSTVGTREFHDNAIGTLQFMWSWAISALPEDMNRDVVPFDSVKDFLVRYRFDY